MFPPKDNRVVQAMWDDGSTSDNASFVVYDNIDKLPLSPHERYWWEFPKLARLPDKSVIAWREVKDIPLALAKQFEIWKMANKLDGRG
jgi:hypothetical protein